MDQQKEQLQAITEIRSMMEKSTRFISLNGLSGVFAGILAVLGAIPVISYFGWGLSQTRFAQLSADFVNGSKYGIYLLVFGDAGIVLFLSVFIAVIMTIRKAKKNGQSYFDKTARRMLVNLAIPLVTGGIFCMILLCHGMHALLAPSTLLFYGLALLNASKYTLNDIRYLGICEIILGLVSSFYTGYGILFWIIGFGFLHIIYGTVMYFKYEK